MAKADFADKNLTLVIHAGRACQYIRLLPDAWQTSMLIRYFLNQLADTMYISQVQNLPHAESVSQTGYRLRWVTPILDGTSESFSVLSMPEAAELSLRMQYETKFPLSKPEATRNISSGSVDSVHAFRFCASLNAIQELSSFVRQTSPDDAEESSFTVLRLIWDAVNVLKSDRARYFFRRCRLAIADNGMVLFVSDRAKAGDFSANTFRVGD